MDTPPATGPSDQKCRHHDSRMVNKCDMAPIKALGYNSIHMCLRDKILSGENILELMLTGDGRAFQLVFRNVNGSHFVIDGGVELLMDVQRRIL